MMVFNRKTVLCSFPRMSAFVRQRWFSSVDTDSSSFTPSDRPLTHEEYNIQYEEYKKQLKEFRRKVKEELMEKKLRQEKLLEEKSSNEQIVDNEQIAKIEEEKRIEKERKEKKRLEEMEAAVGYSNIAYFYIVFRDNEEKSPTRESQFAEVSSGKLRTTGAFLQSCCFCSCVFEIFGDARAK